MVALKNPAAGGAQAIRKTKDQALSTDQKKEQELTASPPIPCLPTTTRLWADMCFSPLGEKGTATSIALHCSYPDDTRLPTIRQGQLWPRPPLPQST